MCISAAAVRGYGGYGCRGQGFRFPVHHNRSVRTECTYHLLSAFNGHQSFGIFIVIVEQVLKLKLVTSER